MVRGILSHLLLLWCHGLLLLKCSHNSQQEKCDEFSEGYKTPKASQPPEIGSPEQCECPILEGPKAMGQPELEITHPMAGWGWGISKVPSNPTTLWFYEASALPSHCVHGCGSVQITTNPLARTVPAEPPWAHWLAAQAARSSTMCISGQMVPQLNELCVPSVQHKQVKSGMGRKAAHNICRVTTTQLRVMQHEADECKINLHLVWPRVCSVPMFVHVSELVVFLYKIIFLAHMVSCWIWQKGLNSAFSFMPSHAM